MRAEKKCSASLLLLNCLHQKGTQSFCKIANKLLFSAFVVQSNVTLLTDICHRILLNADEYQNVRAIPYDVLLEILSRGAPAAPLCSSNGKNLHATSGLKFVVGWASLVDLTTRFASRTLSVLRDMNRANES